LAKKLKLNRQYFQERTSYKDILDALNKLNVNITSIFKDENDYKGAVVQQLIATATHNIPVSFKLSVPIYAGYVAELIQVDIEVIPDGQTIKVCLVSLDLIERQTEVIEGLFQEVKTKLGDLYAIIEK
jgi:hypothetical protein